MFPWKEWTAHTPLYVEAPPGSPTKKVSQDCPQLYGQPAAVVGREVLGECWLLLQFCLKLETHLGGSHTILGSLNIALTLEM